MAGEGGRMDDGAFGSSDPELIAAGIAPEQMLAGYRAGAFPMDSESPNGPVGWYTTDPRAVIRVADARVPATVRRMVRRRGYEVRVDTAFDQVLKACGGDRDGMWLTPRLARGYQALFARGLAHSVEAWDGEVLVGGLFGVAMGGFITAESMFHTAPDGGNAAIMGLIEIARANGVTLIDVQMESPHVMRFGACLMSAAQFERALSRALGAS